MRMRFVVLYLEVETGWKAKKLLGPLNSNNPPIPVFLLTAILFDSITRRQKKNFTPH